MRLLAAEMASEQGEAIDGKRADRQAVVGLNEGSDATAQRRRAIAQALRAA